MGASASTPKVNEVLDQFAGSTHHPLNSDLWKDLGTITFQNLQQGLNEKALATLLDPWVATLVKNNPRTFNFSTLVSKTTAGLHAVPHLIEEFDLALFNNLVLVRSCIRYMVENLSAAELMAQFANPEVPNSYIRALMDFTVEQRVWTPTYILHLECLNNLLVFVSSQLYQPLESKAPPPFLSAILNYAEHVPRFIASLLVHFSKQMLFVPPSEKSSVISSTMSFVGSAASSVVLLPYTTYTYLFDPVEPVGAPVADRSLYLLLVLGTYKPSLAGAEIVNACRTAIGNVHDSSVARNDGGESALPPGTPQCDFPELFGTLTSKLTDERVTLLLYLLLHGNPQFEQYVLARTDVDTLMLPLLKLLYGATRQYHAFMLLICILILSQDAQFNKQCHAVVVPAVAWFKERYLYNITVGSLTVVVLARTMQHNLAKSRDVYTQTHCLATLYNAASFFHDLNPWAAERLTSIFELLAKKYHRLLDKSKAGGGPDVDSEVATYADFIYIVLEIINSSLFVLQHNPQIVYEILHRRELFDKFREQPMFAELIGNIEMVAEHFQAKIPAESDGSVDAVLDSIKKAARDWTPAGLKHLPDIKFRYEEAKNPTDFFTPYVWTVIVGFAPVPWNKEKISLFEGRKARLEGAPSMDESAASARAAAPPAPAPAPAAAAPGPAPAHPASPAPAPAAPAPAHAPPASAAVEKSPARVVVSPARDGAVLAAGSGSDDSTDSAQRERRKERRARKERKEKKEKKDKEPKERKEKKEKKHKDATPGTPREKDKHREGHQDSPRAKEKKSKKTPRDHPDAI